MFIDLNCLLGWAWPTLLPTAPPPRLKVANIVALSFTKRSPSYIRYKNWTCLAWRCVCELPGTCLLNPSQPFQHIIRNNILLWCSKKVGPTLRLKWEKWQFSAKNSLPLYKIPVDNNASRILFVYVPFVNFSLIETSTLPMKGFKFWPKLHTHGHWAVRVL